MPTPRQMERAREFFGFGPLEAYELFKPALNPEDPRYTPAARDQFFMAEAAGRDRNAMRSQWAAEDEAAVADQAAEQILQQSRGMSSSGLQKLLADTPEVFKSRQFPILSQMQRMKEEAEKPNPFSDQVLGPQFASRINNPVLRQQFEDDMIAGKNANAAWTNHLNREFNYGHELKLAQAGVPKTEWEKFRGPNGLYDETAIVSALRKPQADMGLRDLETRIKMFDNAAMRDSMGDLLPEFVPAFDAVTKEYKARLLAAYPGAPPPEQMGPPDKLFQRLPKTEETPPSTLDTSRRLLPEERAAAEQEDKKKIEVANEWGRNEQDLLKRIQKVFPTEQAQFDALNAIVSGRESPEAVASAGTGMPFVKAGPSSYATYVLKKLGLKPTEVAFVEPHNLRTGSQKVNYRELLDVLAKKRVAEMAGKAQQAQQPQQQELSPAAKAIIEQIQKGV